MVRARPQPRSDRQPIVKEMIAMTGFILGCAVPVMVSENSPPTSCRLLGQVVGEHGRMTGERTLYGTRQAALFRLRKAANALHANTVYATDEGLLICTDLCSGSIVRLVGDAYLCPGDQAAR
jgi:uncharacterized protein YbjQ (UPF0145 family)